MSNIINKEESHWVQPWELTSFDNLYNKDDRFFSLVIKGMLSWFNRNIILYNKPIIHFIFNTGSSYLFMESNGYEYNMKETTGEDQLYMSMPRCLVEFNNVTVQTEELSNSYAFGSYERINNNDLSGYSAIIKRIPLELSIRLKYILSNFNESIVLLQELIDKIVFQKYYNITYLGKAIECSIEFPTDFNIEINKIDMASPDVNQKTIELDIKINTNYPIIDKRSEIASDNIISSFKYDTQIVNGDFYNSTDSETIIKDD